MDLVTGSAITEVTSQADGRRYVKEKHTFESGKIEERIYLDGIDDNLTALLQKHAEEINQREIDKEIIDGDN